MWFKKRIKSAASTPPNGEAKTNLSDLFAPGAVKVNLESMDKEEALEELVDLLVQTGGIKDREAALACLRKREELGSTGIGGGIAIPHGKDESVECLVGAVGTSASGIDFEALDGKPAKVVFLLLARSDQPGPHIQALAKIAELVVMPKFLDRMIGAKNSAEILDIFRAEE